MMILKTHSRIEIEQAITELRILLQKAQIDFYPDRRKAIKLALIILQETLKNMK